jgi:hypothetical protein
LNNKTKKDIGIWMILDNTHYCPSCYNKIKDNDETDVDCGGSCVDCAKIIKESLIFDNFWKILILLIAISLSIIILYLFMLFIKYFILTNRLKKLETSIKE